MAGRQLLGKGAREHPASLDRVLAFSMGPERIDKTGRNPQNHRARVGGFGQLAEWGLISLMEPFPVEANGPEPANGANYPDSRQLFIKKVYENGDFRLQLREPSLTLKVNRCLKSQTVDIGAWLGRRLLVGKKAPGVLPQRKASPLCQMLSH